MKIGRNDPCPCGSGRKFKHCCGALNAEPRASGAETRASGENLFRLASAHHASGRLGEAERCYRQILKASGTRPDSPMPHFNLGVVLEEQGRLDEAISCYRKAVEIDPSCAVAHYNLGVAFDSQGAIDESIACYRSAVGARPDYPDALYNLAFALEKKGPHEEAIEIYRRVLKIEPRSIDALTNLGTALVHAGRVADAISCYRQALAVDPRSRPVHDALAAAYRLAGKPEEVLDVYQRAVSLEPANGDLHSRLGTAMIELGRIEDALAPYRQGLALRHQPGTPAPLPAPVFSRATRAKLQHDLEQLNYLIGHGLVSGDFRKYALALEEALRALDTVAGKCTLADLPVEVAHRLAPFYNRAVNVYEASRLPGGAISSGLDCTAIEADYHKNFPGITFFDDFLTPQALNELRRFCLESTIWYDFAYNNGYVGAMMDDGFFCPLLVQIACELPRALPGIFGNHRLTQMWAYKYDSELSGIEAHADFAAVNVNFWITSDEANLSPGTGGLMIWDKEAPHDWDFEAYNRTPERIRDYLRESNAAQVVVPYKQNRVVVFNSDLFHKTDGIHFLQGYENRRINVTLLYGRREDA